MRVSRWALWAMASMGLAHAGALLAEPPSAPLPAGTYSNEEQVYFAREGGETPPPLVFLNVGEDGTVTQVDAFGMPMGTAPPQLTLTPSERGLSGALPDSGPDTPMLDLRRARPASCWVAIRKDTPKPDGSEDWAYAPSLAIHDQGGRARFGGGDSGAPEVVLRIRHVVWPKAAEGQVQRGPNLVLYIHRPDAPDRAEAYAWADDGANRIGINLRWMQASCTLTPTE